MLQAYPLLAQVLQKEGECDDLNQKLALKLCPIWASWAVARHDLQLRQFL